MANVSSVKLNSVDTENIIDIRPRAYEKTSKKWILVDTGAMVSVWPKADYPDAKKDNKTALEAVNKTKIATYGRIERKLNLSEGNFVHMVYIADVPAPVLGLDFLFKYKLDIRWQGDIATLVNGRNKTKATLSCTTVPLDMLHLSAVDIQEDEAIPMPTLPQNNVSFQTWSKQQTQEANKKAKPIINPEAYLKIVEKYPSVLQSDFKISKPRHGVFHTIDTGNNRPCKAKVRPLLPGSPKERKGKEAWTNLEKLGIIKRVNPREPNLWTSALHLAPKTDGDLRPCGDFRILNDATLLDGYPLPNLRHFSAKIKGSTVFSKIDLVKAYHQVPLDTPSSKKTCVITPWGAFRFLRMAMGLRNAAQSFQRMMQTILHDFEDIFIYLDDILIFSKDEASHQDTLDRLLKRLQENDLSISLDKCVFGAEVLDFVGYKVDTSGITPLPKKLEAIAKYPSPQKPKQLLGFLGAINYYRRSMPKIKGKHPAQILQPLYDAATKKTPGKSFLTIWEEKGLQCHFDDAKQMIMQACKLQHPDPALPLALTTDASKSAIGAVLEQYEGGEWRPLGFWSRHLKPDKAKWTTFRRELLAVKEGIRHFIDEIQGRHLIVYTDHRPIVGAFKSQNSQNYDPIAMNHIQEIANHTSDIRFLSGKSNIVADWLSRPPDTPLGKVHQMPSQNDLEIAALQSIALETVSHENLAKAQAKCPEVDAHLQGLHQKDLKIEKIEFSPGIFLVCDTSNGKKARPIVPKPMRDLIIKLYHQLNHPGQKVTNKKVQDQYYWPNMRKDISLFVKTCHHCQACKINKSVMPATKQLQVPDRRFSELQIDVVGPLPESEGMRYLLTILDRTTRWLEAIPMAEATAANCCLAFLRGWAQRFGLPKKATSDNGNTFVSNLWQDLHAILGIEVYYTPLYHASSLGHVERQHRDLKMGLKTTLHEMADTHGHQWMSRLPWVLLGRRTSFQPELQSTSAELVFGQNPTVPGDLIDPISDNEATPALQDMLEGLRKHAAKPAIQTAHHRDIKTNMPPDVSSATHVYIRRGKTPPLGHNYDGPFEIEDRLSDSTIQVRVGSFADGRPRYEKHHWSNCKVAVTTSEVTATKPNKGRKPSKKMTRTTPTDPVTTSTTTPEDATSPEVQSTAPEVETDFDDISPATPVVTRSGRLSRPPLRY